MLTNILVTGGQCAVARGIAGRISLQAACRIRCRVSPDSVIFRGYVIYRIDTEAMIKNGCKFWQAENGVWLTKIVPPSCMEEISGESTDMEMK